jgi:DNA-binding transcriptional MerR regulator/methylmalonyl-CoA mutase cobalamin-binding subunit
MNSTKRYPIKTVANKTGLSVHVIRVWEKRYQVVEPERTDTNRRLYSEEDIKKLSLLGNLTQQGYSISSIADLDLDQLTSLANEFSGPDLQHIGNTDLTDDSKILNLLNECIEAVKNFDASGLEKALIRASFEVTQPVLVRCIINPLLEKIGEFWQEGEIRIMHEHMATAVLMPFLANMRNAYRPAPNAPSMIVATPLGQIHEMGALVIALVAAAAGWKVTYIGPSLPAEEIAAAVLNKSAKLVVLSIVYPGNDPLLPPELSKLSTLLPESTEIIVGGAAAENYRDILIKIGAQIISDLSDFRSYLVSTL